jgi:hypothetical protein
MSCICNVNGSGTQNAVESLALFLHVRRVLGSNLSSRTDYPDGISRSFPQSSKYMPRKYLRLYAKVAAFQISPSLLFTSHPVTCSYIVRATIGVVKQILNDNTNLCTKKLVLVYVLYFTCILFIAKH